MTSVQNVAIRWTRESVILSGVKNLAWPYEQRRSFAALRMTSCARDDNFAPKTGRALFLLILEHGAGFRIHGKDCVVFSAG